MSNLATIQNKEFFSFAVILTGITSFFQKKIEKNCFNTRIYFLKDEVLPGVVRNLSYRANKLLEINAKSVSFHMEQYFTILPPEIEYYLRVKIEGEIYHLAIAKDYIEIPKGVTTEMLLLLKRKRIEIVAVVPKKNF